MDAIRVAVVDWSGMDLDWWSGIDALQRQLDRDFGPVWNVQATLQTWPGRVRRDGVWGLVLLDRNALAGSLQAQALTAYGHLTSYGHPLARAFVEPGRDWTHPASHALLEMLADPFRSAAVYRDDGHPFHVYARRVCDPCADYSYGYRVGEHTVCDFVCPAWFGCSVPDGRFDVRGNIHHPFEVLHGGRIAVVDPQTSEWRQLRCDGSLQVPVVEPPVVEAVAAVAGRTKPTWGP